MVRNKEGFTLIELIIVMIIIGVLAAIAAPMMAGNSLKAKKSEAVAALGAINTAMKLYYLENSSYPSIGLGNIGNGTANLGAYIKTTDLDGKYFNNMAYNTWGGSGGSCANTKISSDPSLSAQPNDGYCMIYLYMNGKLDHY